MLCAFRVMLPLILESKYVIFNLIFKQCNMFMFTNIRSSSKKGADYIVRHIAVSFMIDSVHSV